MPADLSPKDHLLAKIAAKEATVAVIGLGYIAAAHPGTTREEIVPGYPEVRRGH